MKKLTYAPMRTYSSTRRMAKRYAELLRESTQGEEDFTMVEAVDQALFLAVALQAEANNVNRLAADIVQAAKYDFPGYDHNPDE